MGNDTSTIIPVEIFSDVERLALAGFLGGYSGRTRNAYALDLRQFASWCSDHGLRLFGVRRADIECFGRDLEATTRRALTSAVPATTTSPGRWAWTGYELGALLVEAGLSGARDHALISLHSTGCGSPKRWAPTSRPWALNAVTAP